MNLALMFALFFSASAFAKQGECESHITIDQRYIQVQESDLPKKEKRIAYSQLINEAYSPVLREIRRKILELSSQEIIALANDIYIDYVPNELAEEKIAEYRKNGFDGLFSEIIRGYTKSSLLYIGRAGLNENNGEMIRKFVTASYVVGKFVQLNIDFKKFDSVNESHKLIVRHTFSEDRYRELMELGYQSVIQSVAQLTSDPVGNFNTEELLQKVITPRGKMPSLVVLHSLSLAPAVLGQHGTRLYVKNPLVVNEQCGLSFSPHFRDFLKKERGDWVSSPGKGSNEFGTGCPVAHATPGADQPSLQDLLDAIMYVYGVLK